MPLRLSPYEFSLFSQYMKSRSGVEIRPNKAYLIETRLTKLIGEGGYSSFYRLYRAMCDDPDGKLAGQVVDALTTHETLWFRDSTPWEYLEQEQLPRLVRELRAGQRQRVRIWSAAASTGQEAYSAAILIDRYLRANRIFDVTPAQFEILGTDISSVALARARAGRYDRMAITRGLDAEIRQRYFIHDGEGYQLRDEIRRAVVFRHFNLMDSFVPLGSFDVVFLRYVMIYLSDEARQDILTRLHPVVRPDGVLFLGASELCRDTGAFSSRHFNRSLIYIRSGDASPAPKTAP